MGTELYPQSSTVSSFNSSGLWPVLAGNKELDLRKEFHEFLFGSATEVPKGQVGILRRMRKDDNGNLIPCACVDKKTGEPDLDTFCPYCHGEGYIYDEEWIAYYRVLVSSQEGMVRKNQAHRAGMSNIPFVFFYLEYNVEPSRVDKIVEVSRDVDGGVLLPYTEEAIYPIATLEPFRSDSGRIEYWRLASVLSSVKSNWQG